MGLLTFLSKPAPKLTRLASGSFTVDALGRVLASTLPHSFSAAHLGEISSTVLTIFKEARHADLPLSEIIVHYSGIKITARELRGGAIVFLKPKLLQPYNT